MSDAAEDKKDDKPAAAGGGNKKLMIIVLATNVLLAGGLGYVVMSGKSEDPDPKAAHGKADGEEDDEEDDDEEDDDEEDDDEGAEGEDGKGGGHAKAKFGPLLEVGTFVANLSVPPGEQPRYAKVSIHVEAANEDAKARVEGALVPIKTEALMLLSNAKPEDVIGQDKIQALSDTLLKRAHKLVGKKAVKRVFLSELVIQ